MFRILKSKLHLAIFVPRLRGFQTPDSTHTSWFPAIYFGGSRRPTLFVPAVLAAIFRIHFGGSRRTHRTQCPAKADVLRGSNFAIATVLRVS